ncbi:SDR family NAD(P)-dependent oxidoreductase [Serratia ureilytica]
MKRLASEGAAVALPTPPRPIAPKRWQAPLRRRRQSLAIKADSADAAALQQAVRQAVSQFGNLDILVNNAGCLRWAAPRSWRWTIWIACWRSTCAACSSPAKKRRAT